MNVNLEEQIGACLETVLGYPLKTTLPEAREIRLQEDLGMESLQLVELQIELESMFRITFDPMEDDFFEIFQTVGSLYDTMERKLKGTIEYG